tara:strand:- start:99 stop:872 length:774 start_codon:yes stop_codon:yes gene_type:complete
VKKNLNRRKLLSITKKNILLVIILFFFLSTFFIITKEFKEIKFYLYQSVQLFSEKFNYQLKTFEINGNNRMNVDDVEKLISKYYGVSIFMLPISKISEKIKDDIWIKNIKLSIDYKNNLIIDLEEYNPVGIYKFNKNMFYFSENGNIIDKIEVDLSRQNELLVFSGKLSNVKASSFVETLNKFDSNFIKQIQLIELINERRWNIEIQNNIILKLSEEFPQTSISNYLKLKKNLNKVQMNNIKIFDLRNINKSVLVYK